MAAYWSSRGWRTPPLLPTGQDLEKAVDAGIMFRHPVTLGHDELVSTVRNAILRVDSEDVGAAFVTSLITRRLDLRSALGSFAVGRHLQEHPFTPADGHLCQVCGLPSRPTQDRNVLNFERFKWGGVRRDDLTYVALDLELFTLAPREPLNDSALALCHQLLEQIAAAAASDTAVKIVPKLSVIKGNRAEREVLLEVLSVAGMLETPEHRGYRTEFVEYKDRAATGAHFEDRSYPLPWWRGHHGVNSEADREWFPLLA